MATSNIRIRLPSGISGISLPYLMPVELNTFDSDLLLPALYYRVLAHGRERSGGRVARYSLDEFVAALRRRVRVVGGDDEAQHEVLRTAISSLMVVTARSGLAWNSGREQILTVLPHSLLAYRPGFPAETSQLRRTDTFLYRCIVAACDGSRRNADRMFRAALGHGLTISPVANGLEGAYDGVTELDTVTRLSLAFIESIPPRRPEPLAPDLQQQHEEQRLPADAAIGRDILAYVTVYAGRMPTAALGYDLQGLLSMELLLDSLQRMQQASALIDQPADSSVPSREIYLDFNDDPDSVSGKMAAGQVWRDLELGRQYLRAALRLYQLNRYLADSLTDDEFLAEAGIASGQHTLTGIDYYRAILQLSQSKYVRSNLRRSAADDERAIRDGALQANRGKSAKRTVESSEDDLEAEAEQRKLLNRQLDLLLETVSDPVEKTATLLYLSQIDHYVQNYQQWFIGAGGLKKTHGLVRGTISRRQSWRYAPGNDLLAILVQLAAAHQAHDGGRRDGRISLRAFLQFLEQRFGLLIDRPPAEFCGPEYNAAARENLRALQRRLQQMGMFDDLSDDFTVQQLQAPYFDGFTREPA